MVQLGDEALVAILAICHVNRSCGSLIFIQRTHAEAFNLRF